MATKGSSLLAAKFSEESIPLAVEFSEEAILLTVNLPVEFVPFAVEFVGSIKGAFDTFNIGVNRDRSGNRSDLRVDSKFSAQLGSRDILNFGSR